MSSPSPRHRHLANLIVAAHADHAAFKALHALTREYLYHVALTLLRSPSLAEEALQEAYLSIWLHAGSFRPGVGSPMTWLIAIVRNRALSMLRSHACDPIIASPEAALAEANAEVDASADATGLAQLEGALMRLAPPHRQTIALAFGRDMTHAEMAQHLGVPLGTAKSWLRRGLERLRTCLEEAGTPHRPGSASVRPGRGPILCPP
ncbi:RNA polymerase sigma factor [Pseudoduganella plicata]|nr:sigma-70 family RNA polymerase sigma factor [Pseudoduganella plicata]GGY97436.1 RNA polymerase sigma factor [Pseudoduganella plicata]